MGGILCIPSRRRPEIHYIEPDSSLPALNEEVVIAYRSIEGKKADELSFGRGDVLDVIRKSEEMWYARNRESGRTGYIPKDSVVPYQLNRGDPWYFGYMQGPEAEQLLLRSVNENGSFLIRRRDPRTAMEGDLEVFALSVKADNLVKHYVIKLTSQGDYYISHRAKFGDLPDLVRHYTAIADGLVTCLREPCIWSYQPIGTQNLPNGAANEELSCHPSLNFTKADRLGAGQFGEVYKGMWKGDTPVAIKVLRPGSMNKTSFQEEVMIMRKFKHKNVVTYLGAVSTNETMFIVTELMSKGSLLDHLRKYGNSIAFKTLVYFDSQVAQGMAFLESRNVIHRDLAARNVLVGDNDVVKISDFGLARHRENGMYETKSATKVPTKWAAPEALSHDRFTSKSDVWSFGILMYEVVTYGGNPYPGKTCAEALAAVERGYRMERPTDCEDQYYEIMVQCWEKNPDERPTFEKLAEKLDTYFEEQKNQIANSGWL